MLFGFVTGTTSMGDGKQGLEELQETKTFTWELSVSHLN
jgi:hypothetical protein